MIRGCLLASVLAAALLALTAGGSAALPRPPQATVSVGGAVATPSTYSLAQLDALPPTTFTVNEHWWHGCPQPHR